MNHVRTTLRVGMLFALLSGCAASPRPGSLQAIEAAAHHLAVKACWDAWDSFEKRRRITITNPMWMLKCRDDPAIRPGRRR